MIALAPVHPMRTKNHCIYIIHYTVIRHIWLYVIFVYVCVSMFILFVITPSKIYVFAKILAFSWPQNIWKHNQSSKLIFSHVTNGLMLWSYAELFSLPLTPYFSYYQHMVWYITTSKKWTKQIWILKNSLHSLLFGMKYRKR